MFSSNSLQDKFALITGGGSGICYEITRQLLLAGCSGVVICGRRETFLQDACKVLQNEMNHRHTNNNNNHVLIHYCVCDVRKSEQCIKAVQYCNELFHGKLDIVVNGAAGNFLSPANTLSPNGFATVMSIDALGTFNMSHAAYPLLVKRRKNHHTTTITTTNTKNDNDHIDHDEGIIINISATLQYGATWWQAHASAAKAAVDSLTRSLALEWGPIESTKRSIERSIRVVGIAPGPIANTPGTTKLAPTVKTTTTSTQKKTTSSTNHNTDIMATKVQHGIPLGRMGYSYEIGQAAVFLCLSKFITGHVLVVDGGEWLYREPFIPKEMVTKLSRSIEAQSRSQKPTTSTTTVHQSKL